MKKSSSLSGFIKRLFSSEKSKPETAIKKVDSCKNLIDIKEILKEKTKENVASMKDIGTTSTVTTEVRRPAVNQEEVTKVYFNKITEAKTLRMPPKGKAKTPSVTQYHPHCLIYSIDAEGEYLIVYLTNGIRQVIKEGENYVILNDKYVCDRTGGKLVYVPRIVTYIIKERLKEGACKLSESTFEDHVQRRNFILKYRQLGTGSRLFVLGNSSIVTTAAAAGVFFLHSEYCEFLYNGRLETVNNDQLLKQCQ